jgi:hypothetical protein
MEEKMKKAKKVVSAILTVTLTTGIAMGSMQAYARSSTRAAWNNASGSTTTGSTVSEAHYIPGDTVNPDKSDTDTPEYTVYSNVYADSSQWATWQTTWNTIRSNYEQVALTPGKNATELNFGWCSLTQETPMVKLMDSNGNVIKTFEGTQDTANKQTVTESGKQYILYSGKVTITGLAENTTYKYQYLADGKWSDTYTYKTEATEKFSVMYVGDPQIGASVGQDTNSAEYHAMNDAYNWNQTLNHAVTAHSNLSFILSAGDQINQTDVSSDTNKLEQQIEYAGFLSSSVLRSLPLATTIGNHDSKSVNYANHFNNPNAATASGTTTGATAAGSDYYFTYGNTLFVVIDTNNYNCATHENVIKEATQANPNVKWRVLMFHQDIYGSGYDHSDSDGIQLRTQLTPIVDKYDFDIVLQGHDHTYSRSYQLSATGTTENTTCYDILTSKTSVNKVIDPKGTAYFEANSSTGSKFYQLIGTQQNYIAARSQSWRPTYSVIDFTDVSLTVKTYDAATNQELVADGGVETAYTIIKSADKSSLNKEISSAQTAYNNAVAAGTYTQESLANLSAVIAAAEAIEQNAESDSTAVASAVSSLSDAVNALALIKTNSDAANTTGTGTNTAVDTSAVTDNSQNAVATADSAAANTSNSATTAIKTGDSILPMVLWFTLGGVSFAGLAYIVITERKKKRKAL